MAEISIPEHKSLRRPSVDVMTYLSCRISLSSPRSASLHCLSITLARFSCIACATLVCFPLLVVGVALTSVANTSPSILAALMLGLVDAEPQSFNLGRFATDSSFFALQYWVAGAASNFSGAFTALLDPLEADAFTAGADFAVLFFDCLPLTFAPGTSSLRIFLAAPTHQHVNGWVCTSAVPGALPLNTLRALSSSACMPFPTSGGSATAAALHTQHATNDNTA